MLTSGLRSLHDRHLFSAFEIRCEASWSTNEGWHVKSGGGLPFGQTTDRQQVWLPWKMFRVAPVQMNVISFTGKHSSLFTSPLIHHGKLHHLYPFVTILYLFLFKYSHSDTVKLKLLFLQQICFYNNVHVRCYKLKCFSDTLSQISQISKFSPVHDVLIKPPCKKKKSNGVKSGDLGGQAVGPSVFFIYLFWEHAPLPL